MDLIPSLELLAKQTLSGISFVAAYGLTWLICGILWRRASSRTAAYATLFQGMAAFPLALGGSALVGAIGQARPVAEEITQLSVLIGTSQLLGLPLLILLVVKRWYTVVPIAFATLTSMHFVLYSWLYRTPVYIVLAVGVAVGAALVTGTATAAGPMAGDTDDDHLDPARPQAAQLEESVREDFTAIGAARVCALTGGLLLASAAALGILHAIG